MTTNSKRTPGLNPKAAVAPDAVLVDPESHGLVQIIIQYDKLTGLVTSLSCSTPDTTELIGILGRAAFQVQLQEAAGGSASGPASRLMVPSRGIVVP